MGVFGVVLECIPNTLAQRITENITIPTIGIGAGNSCSGQVLVWHDALGLNTQHIPRFVRAFSNGADQSLASLNRYADAVRDRSFPSHNESYGA